MCCIEDVKIILILEKIYILYNYCIQQDSNIFTTLILDYSINYYCK